MCMSPAELHAGAGSGYIAKDSKGRLFLSPADKSLVGECFTCLRTVCVCVYVFHFSSHIQRMPRTAFSVSSMTQYSTVLASW